MTLKKVNTRDDSPATEWVRRCVRLSRFRQNRGCATEAGSECISFVPVELVGQTNENYSNYISTTDYVLLVHAYKFEREVAEGRSLVHLLIF